MSRLFQRFVCAATTKQKLAEEDRLRIAMDRFVRSRTAGSSSAGMKKFSTTAAAANSSEQVQQQAQGK